MGQFMTQRKKSRWVALPAIFGLALAASALPATVSGEVKSSDVSSTSTASAFGQLPAYEFVEISPDGQRLAYVTVVGEARNLLVTDLATEGLIGGSRAGDVKVRGLSWLGNDQIFVTLSATEAVPNIGMSKSEITRGEIYDIESRQLRRVLGGTPGVVPMLAGGVATREYRGRETLFVDSLLFERGGFEGFRLYRIDAASGRGSEVEDWGKRPPSYVLDASGEPIARANYYADSGRWVLMRRKGSFWEEAWTTTALLDQPSLVGRGRSEGSVIVRAVHSGDTESYREMDIATGAWSDLPFEGDPDGLLRHPRTGLVIGAVYSKGDRPEFQYSDPVAALTWRSISAAFAGRHPSMTSWSDDMRKVVVRTWGEDDAGTYHLVNLDAGTASTIGEQYPSLTRVGEVRSVSYPASDGMTIPGYLTLPPGVSDPKDLPLVVLPHGGPQARDTLGFDWWSQALAARGYAVLQPNFRGSDGLGKAHLEAGYGEWGGKMQTDLSDGVRWLAQQGIIDPKRTCIVGASYGGYAALAGPTIDPGVYRCAVSVAGVSDLRRMVAWTADNAGRDNSPAVRYWNRFMGAERVGDRALDARSPRQQASIADAPILLLHGFDDTVVPFEQSRLMADALQRAGKPHELIRLDGEDHWLSMTETRQRMLAETIRFLEQHNPPT